MNVAIASMIAPATRQCNPLQAQDSDVPPDSNEADLHREWDQKEQWYARAVSYWDKQVPSAEPNR
jgi:hypothetical protein